MPILTGRHTDFRSMTPEQQLAALDEWDRHLVYFWTIHGWINLSLVPATALTEFCHAELPPE